MRPRRQREQMGIRHTLRRPTNSEPGGPYPSQATHYVSKLQPLSPNLQLLIETFAIRNANKPNRINHIYFSNRDKTTPFARIPISRPLIATPAIRIFPKSPGINHLKISNRHKTPLPGTLLHQAPSVLFSLFTFLVSPSAPLIGPPVIRIWPKPFRISAQFDSNRRERRPLSIDQISPY